MKRAKVAKKATTTTSTFGQYLPVRRETQEPVQKKDLPRWAKKAAELGFDFAQGQSEVSSAVTVALRALVKEAVLRAGEAVLETLQDRFRDEGLDVPECLSLDVAKDVADSVLDDGSHTALAVERFAEGCGEAALAAQVQTEENFKTGTDGMAWAEQVFAEKLRIADEVALERDRALIFGGLRCA